ncbi:MAG: Hcp family type secretion system effector [Cyanobacteria bacterium RYN_339]|nr:Hcp family type secretion system effector [Cyanobacteria bacterium RYN_339]
MRFPLLALCAALALTGCGKLPTHPATLTANPMAALDDDQRPEAVAAALAKFGLLGVSRGATTIFVTITGATQGAFKGGVASGDHKGQTAATGFSYEVSSPRDAASGMASGKRMHKPICISKEWDAASPQLMQALATNENLSTVSIDFVTANLIGKQTTQYTVKLTNASLASLTQASGDLISDKTPTDSGTREELAFTFQKIEFKAIAGKTTATDDWVSLQ